MKIIPGTSPELIDFILKLKLRVLAVTDNKEKYPHKAIRKWAVTMIKKYKSPWVQSLPNALATHQFSFFEAQKMLETFKQLTAEDVVISITDSNGIDMITREEEPEVVEPKDPFDVDLDAAFAGVDSEENQKRIEALQEGGGEIVEASNDCEGGACKI